MNNNQHEPWIVSVLIVGFWTLIVLGFEVWDALRHTFEGMVVEWNYRRSGKH